MLGAGDFASRPVETIALSDGAQLDSVPGFLPGPAADALFRELADETPWDTNVDGNFARPRRTYWIGDFAYAYSGVVHHPASWTPTLATLRAAVEKLAFGE